MKEILTDVLIGAIFAIVVLVPAYLAYVRGYADGDHDRARWTREHDQCDAMLSERGQHDNAFCDERVEQLQKIYARRDALRDGGR
jgi:hypothetical protein